MLRHHRRVPSSPLQGPPGRRRRRRGRENEGDIVGADKKVTPEGSTSCPPRRGLLCAPMERRAARSSTCPDGAPQHERHATPSPSRSTTATARRPASPPPTGPRRSAAWPTANRWPTDFARPGHIFPLRAREGGVLTRAGHTEAAVDLARLAGCFPAGVICEIVNEDGTMTRLPDLRGSPTSTAEHRHDQRPDRVPPAEREADRAASSRWTCRPPTATSTCAVSRRSATATCTSR